MTEGDRLRIAIRAGSIIRSRKPTWNPFRETGKFFWDFRWLKCDWVAHREGDTIYIREKPKFPWDLPPLTLRKPKVAEEEGKCKCKMCTELVGELRLVGGEFVWEMYGMLYKYDMETELPTTLIGPWDGNN